MGIGELIEAAKNEDWGVVDDKVPEVSKDPNVVDWAYGSGLEDEDGNVRDLAASVIEKAPIAPKKFSGMAGKLYKTMECDENPYVRFRSACALVAHDAVGEHKEEVLRVLHEAETDEDTADIARKYLEKL